MDIEKKAHAINIIIDNVLKNATPIQKYNALLEKVISGERILSELMLKMNKSDAIGFAWEYFYMSPYTWKGNSSNLNIKTITETCQENGKAIVLHYTHALTKREVINRDATNREVTNRDAINPIKGELYCKSTDKDEFGNEVGEEPIFYYGRFDIDKNNFELSFDRLKEGFIEFEPKKELYENKNLFYI